MSGFFMLLLLASLVLFVVSLVNPQKGLFFLKPQSRNRKKAFLYLAFAFFFVLAAGVTSDNSEIKMAQEAGFKTVKDWKTANSVNATTPEEYQTYLQNITKEKELKAQEKAKLEAEEAEKRQKEKEAEELACKDDLQCMGDKFLVAAAVLCKGHVEALGQYDFEWTDGMLEPKFSHFRWKNKNKGIVTFIGDKIKFQNGFGAWQIHTYECDFDTENNTPLEVRAKPGRIK